jgi:tetratricopeptide (TPR) repeat protein
MYLLAIIAASAAEPAPYFDDLGSWHRAITTSSPEAQRYFDQGLRLVYAFNRDEAVRSFRWARTLDPGCAMCAWGAAYALGPDINMGPMPEKLEQAEAEIEEAVRLSANASDVEQALIAALAERYGAPYTVEAQAGRDVAYAEAMRGVAADFPDDPDVGTLFAESLMDLHPWDYWIDGQPRPETSEMVAVLEEAIGRWQDHPGANHYYVHAVEASPAPERAIDAAFRLGGLMPGAGHLVHMPAHIWLRVGRYWDAAEANRRAIRADEAYYANGGLRGSYQMYTLHNWAFLSQAEMFLGDADAAVEAARGAIAAAPRDLLRQMTGWDAVLAGPALMYARFGRWDEALAEPLPAEDLAYPAALGHYARGIALAATGQPAEEELDEIGRLGAEIPEGARQGQNRARDLLAIAERVLEARIAVADGRLEEGISRFQEAITMEDTLRYDEPSDWPWPVRHDLAEALTAAGRTDEADAVWREELEHHPQDPWAVRALQR